MIITFMLYVSNGVFIIIYSKVLDMFTLHYALLSLICSTQSLH